MLFPTRFNNKQWLRFASQVSVFVSLCLVVSKSIAWSLSDSTAMLGSLLDSCIDACIATINFFAIRYAMIPADSNHPFGHGKASALAILIQAIIFSSSAVILLASGAKQIWSPQKIESSELVIFVSILAILLTLILLYIQKIAIRKTDSDILKADNVHYRSDFLLNLGVITTLVFSQYLGYWLDGLFAMLIGLWLASQSRGLIKQSISQLMDQQLNEETLAFISTAVLQDPQIIDMHDLKTRQSDNIQFIQLHISLDSAMPLKQAHEVGMEVQSRIIRRLPNAQVIIHFDPK